ncbi:DUF1801 domain-containing protein [Flavobacterium alvei]|uniref:DUF1801 domain-containing protein n=1 Tax=Flavobacterium alvei TaxID=2080416 RepID=UPI0026EA9D0C|nr:DUF1801 domain-containing protein [Flavobacterium alvei]
MPSSVHTVEDYLNEIPEERKEVFQKLRDIIRNNISEGFVEQMSYGMIGYIVPHSTYPSGYHCNPKLPLPFLNIASQKNFIAIYHMGIYVNPQLMDWFITEFPKHSNQKLDMGKSCIRFKKLDQIPFDLIAELAGKMTVEDWIECYETQIKNRKSN